MIPMTDERERPDVINNGNNITCISTSTIGSLCVSEVTEIRESGKQNVEFSPRFTKSQNNGSKDLRDNSVIEEPPLQDLSERMLTLYLQHLGNSVYLMLIMALGFVYPLINALSYGTEKYEKSKEQFEIFMIIIHGISIIVLSLVLIRLTLRKSDEDRGHGEGLNFFLRIGAIVFCIGVIILNILRALEPIELQLIFKCHVPVRPTHVFYYSLSVIFYALQTYFMFKYHKTSFLSGPNRHEGYVISMWFIRFSLMHLTGANLIQWMASVMGEALEVFHSASQLYAEGKHDEMQVFGDYYCMKRFKRKSTAGQMQPFLLPCVIEYSLVVAGIFMAMYQGLESSETTYLLEVDAEQPPLRNRNLSIIEQNEEDGESIISFGGSTLNWINKKEDTLPTISSGSRSRFDDRQSIPFLPTYLYVSREIDRHRTGKLRANHLVASQRTMREKLKPLNDRKHALSFLFSLSISVFGLVYIVLTFLAYEEKYQKFGDHHYLQKYIFSTFRVLWIFPYVIGSVLTIKVCRIMFYKFKYAFRLSHNMEHALLNCTYFATMIFLMMCLVADFDNFMNNRVYKRVDQFFNVVNVIVQSVEETAQYIFLFCGSNMRVKTKEQRLKQVGRSYLCILIALNLLMWFKESMLLGRYVISEQYITFYGQMSWCLLAGLCLPMAIFYRFHSAAIMATIWSNAYL